MNRTFGSRFFFFFLRVLRVFGIFWDVTTVYAMCPASTVKQYVPIDLLSAVESLYNYPSHEDFVDLSEGRILLSFLNYDSSYI